MANIKYMTLADARSQNEFLFDKAIEKAVLSAAKNLTKKELSIAFGLKQQDKNVKQLAA